MYIFTLHCRLLFKRDILNILLELPVSSLPVYVSKDLNKLPPLSLKNFDVSSLVNSVESLQHQMKIMNEGFVSSLRAQTALSEKVTTHEAWFASHTQNVPSVHPASDNVPVDSHDKMTSAQTSAQRSSQESCVRSMFSSHEHTSDESDLVIVVIAVTLIELLVCPR